jgi:hypothetical protein
MDEGRLGGWCTSRLFFRNLSYEGSSGDEEEERETEYSGAAWNLQKCAGEPWAGQYGSRVLSIEQCRRSMIFRFLGSYWLREPICLGSSRIMYPVKAETMEPAMVMSSVPA